MANVIDMPLLSDTMEEGVIAEVYFKVGDKISGGDVIADVETDKATLEVEAYDEHEGVLLHIAGVGDGIPVGGILAITGQEGEDISELLAGGVKQAEATPSENGQAEPAVAESAPSAPSPAPEVVPAASGDSRVKASPLAKKMAADHGLSLASISGSGDEGRIIKRDIESALQNGNAAAAAVVPVAGVAAVAAAAAPAPQAAPAFIPAPAVGEESSESVRTSQMRKTIAKRLGESKFTMPHFYLTMEINMDKVMQARKDMNEISPVKISFNDLVLKASALALRQHPEVNSSWQGDSITINKHVHVGMAVAIPDGLVVPVIKFADTLPLSSLAATTKDMGGRAKSGNLSLDEMKGGTFSVSNLGMMGIEEFTAIINPPNAAIMAVGGINKRMRDVGGEMKAVNVMKVTLSCDHRVVDGAVGSRFLNTFKTYLEHPVTMLV
ncbi:MAG: 2-oxo acid dehydrogenase subunit E2 [Saprospiraceae bacterium]|nr:2-oxo acid dehydrogenase subunit E2 [Saprospiraceae bacterium]